MEVRGVSPERVDAVEAASVVNGQVDPAGNLVLYTKGGQAKNAGAVVKPLWSWPVGSIYIGTTSTNPSVLFGGGQWERFAKGRVLVGIDENDTAFQQPLGIAGAKTHTLTPSEMPSHSHGGLTGVAGEHQHSHDAVRETGGGANAYSAGGSPLTPGGYTSANGAHNHAINAEGGGQPHNNLQPYINVYMWLRTA